MLQYHLHSIGEETKAEVELGIVLYPEGVRAEAHSLVETARAADRADLDIPANGIARVDGYTILHKPARIIAFQPHMHIRGKRQCLELIYPDVGSGATHRGRQLRELQLQLAPHLQLRRRRAAAGAGGHDSPHHQLARQLDRQQASIPIRATGSATVSARSTRWASRGSAGTT